MAAYAIDTSSAVSPTPRYLPSTERAVSSGTWARSGVRPDARFSPARLTESSVASRVRCAAFPRSCANQLDQSGRRRKKGRRLTPMVVAVLSDSKVVGRK